MAIAFDAASNATTGSGTSLTWAHTCSGANRYLVAQVFSIGDFVSGVTYAGVAMALVLKISTGAGNYTYLWALAAPATGANNLVATYSSSSAYNAGCAASYTGVKQTAQPEASASANSGGTTDPVSVTTITANAWIVAGGSNDAGVLSSVTNGTLRANTTAGAFMADDGPIAAPGSVTLTPTTGSASQGGVVAAVFAPVPVTSTGRMLEVF